MRARRRHPALAFVMVLIALVALFAGDVFTAMAAAAIGGLLGFPRV